MYITLIVNYNIVYKKYLVNSLFFKKINRRLNILFIKFIKLNFLT